MTHAADTDLGLTGRRQRPAAWLVLLAWLPYLCGAILHVLLRLCGSPLEQPVKVLLMPLLCGTLLMLLILFRVYSSNRGLILLAFCALGFSWLGDSVAVLFPAFPSETALMIGFFGAAHILFMWLFLRLRTGRPPLWTVCYLLAYTVLMAVLLPVTGSLSVPVAVYGLLLAGTAACAAGVNRVAAWGGAWFLLSDIILALQLFRPEIMPLYTDAAVMATYLTGQGLLVAGIVSQLRQTAAQRQRSH